jgi:hypothetical protein
MICGVFMANERSRKPLIQPDGLYDRIEASVPYDDPRFVELRATLAAVRTRGKNSPTGRMLGEWALLGFLMVNGKIALGGESGSDLLSAAKTDLAGVRDAQAHVAAALGGLDFE